ncbi:Detected protein of unknown function [Hibiscus syriacus]|uniref:DUF659 domain-containing protein n=1 Tax=Hibiscus syriacus TaxID=106335 RepID=A0A6A2ZV60_HIBSY|nr:Detected protein of unknown function [Hibiscus syriacus]
MQAKNWMHQQQADEYNGEEDVVEIGGRSSKMPLPKKPRQKCLMDMYFTPNPWKQSKLGWNGDNKLSMKRVERTIRIKFFMRLGGGFTMQGSIFVKSLDVSDVSKDVDLLFHVLDKMVEEVGEENVVQVVTNNASAYVKAGKLLEAKRPNIYWTPCVAHCLDLMLEDIGKHIPGLHTKKRNRLAQSRLNDMVFVKFNSALERRAESKETDPILLQDIDESNDWFMKRVEDDEDEDEDEAVFFSEDFTLSDVANASSAYKPIYLTRASKVVNDGAEPSRNDKGKSSAHNPISSRPSRRCLVDEDEMEEDIGVSSDEGDGIVRVDDDDDLEDF